MSARQILVCNCGSSSVKVDLFDLKASDKPLISGSAGRIGTDQSRIEIQGNEGETRFRDHRSAFLEICDSFESKGFFSEKERLAIGHRVVHGGKEADQPLRIDESVIALIDRCSRFAPLHNPANLAGIESAMERYSVPQVAVFDTAFHSSMSEFAYRYAIPSELSEKYDIRRYGFHGPSHEYITLKTAEFLNKPIEETSLVSLHLGNGASACAVYNGKSIETSMGFTPLEGLMMGTRSGDIDPAIVSFLIESEKLSAKEADRLLNKQSGLLGIANSNDMRDIVSQMETGSTEAKLAINMFAHRIRKYIGAYLIQLAHTGKNNGADAIVFTAGIGENSPLIRSMVLDGLVSFGIEIDEKKNQSNSTLLSKESSRIKIMRLPTDEEWMIARNTEKLLAG